MGFNNAFYFYVDDNLQCNAIHVLISTPGVGNYTIGIQNWNSTTDVWQRPSDWTSNSTTLGVKTYGGRIERRRVNAVTTQGAVLAPAYSMQSFALGTGNTQGLEYVTPVTYRYATFSAGANSSTVPTVLQLLNVNSGASVTCSIPVGSLDSLNMTDGKLALSGDLTINPNDSLLIMCMSGGTLLDFQMMLHY